MKEFKKLVSTILCVAMILTTVSPSFALDEETIQSMTPRQSESYENHLEGNTTDEILKIESSTIKIQTEESTLNLIDSENKVKETEEESEEDEVKNPEDIEEPEEDETKNPEDIEEPEEDETKNPEDIEEPEEDETEKLEDIEEPEEDEIVEKLEENDSDNKKFEEDESEKENIENVESIESDKNKIESSESIDNESVNKEELENANIENIDKVNEETFISNNNDNEDDKNIDTENTDNKGRVKNDNNIDTLKTNLENEEKLNIATYSDIDFDNEKADTIENKNNDDISNTIIATSSDTDATENGVSDKINNELLQEIKTNVATSSGVDNVTKDNIATRSEVNVATDSDIDLIEIASDSEMGLFGSDNEVATSSEVGKDEFRFIPGFISPGLNVGIVKYDNEDELFGGGLGASYDARNEKNSYGVSIVPQQIRNQYPYGTCWAFSTIGMMETSILKKGLASSIDLSEAALAYYTSNGLKDVTSYKQYLDKPGLEGNDYTETANFANAGGNSVRATLVATAGVGPVLENKVPYYSLPNIIKNGSKAISKEYAFNNNAYAIADVEYIDSSDINSVKRAILKNGSVGMAFNTDNMKNLDGSWKNNNRSVYYSGPSGEGTNHEVMIIGWNDGISKDNFKYDNTELLGKRIEATGYVNGAWLVRNSWGGGNNPWDGYFWMSYNDLSFDGTFYSIEMIKDNPYKYNYHYDTTAHNSSEYISMNDKIANIYKVTGSNQVLEAVNIPIENSKAEYTIQICTSDKKMNNPMDGTLRLKQDVKQGVAGIHNIELDKKIFLKEGTYFSIVIISNGINGLDVLIDRTLKDNRGAYTREYRNEVQSGQSYIFENGNWKDAVNKYDTITIGGKLYGTSFRIRALANDATYTITLKADNENGDTEILGAKKNEKVKLPKNTFNKPAHQFVCWVDEKGKEYKEGAEITVKSNIVFKAKWKDVGYYVLNNNWYEDIENLQSITNIKISVAPEVAPTNVDETKELEGSYGLIVYRKNTDLIIYGSEQAKIHLSKDASYLFAGKKSSNNWPEFSNLKNIVGINYLDTSQTTNMSYMFYGCLNLTTLDLSSFDTSKVRDMSYMFEWCYNLTTLNLSNFNTGEVENMSYMFDDCKKLTALNLSNFNTSKVRDMSYMFGNVENLKTLDLSNFNTSEVQKMFRMFYGAKNIETLDLSNFNTSNVTNIGGMFCYCSNLDTIFTKEDFNLTKASENSSMFFCCFALRGGNGTAYNGSHTDKEYARIDRKETPGYFTRNCYELSPNWYNSEVAKKHKKEITSIKIIKEGDEPQKYDVEWDIANSNGLKCYLNGTEVIIYAAKNLTIYTAEDSSYLFSSNISGEEFKMVEKIDGLNNLNTSGTINMSHMFDGCRNLTTLNLSNFNTSKVRYMSHMFCDCYDLTTLNLSSFNTSNVRSMSNMFMFCHNLATLNLSEFNTSMVEDMLCMFYYCANLTTLDLSSFNTSSVTDMTNMFGSCNKITQLDLSSFESSKLTKASYMFWNCSNLDTIFTAEEFDLTKISESAYMFSGCYKLKGGNNTTYNSSHTDKSYARIDAEETPGYFTEKYYELSPSWYNTNAMGIKKNNITKIKILKYPEAKPENYNKEYDIEGSNGLKCYLKGTEITIYAPKKLSIYTVEDSSYLFSDNISGEQFQMVEKIDGLNNLNTSKTTNMSCMFYDCKSLTSLNLSNFDTENVEDMSGMFQWCNNLVTLNLSSFNTSKVRYMAAMFYSCSKTTQLNVSNFDTSSVKDMDCMFYACSSLTSLNVSNFNTSNVEDMSYMFDDCSELTTLDVSNFSTGKVKYMVRMFSNCSKLTTLDLSKFDTRNVIDMTNMFNYCENLVSLDLNNFNTKKVNNMFYMFYNCNKLTTLNLDNFNTSNVQRMDYMFSKCAELKKIDLSSFSLDKLTNVNNMFDGCTKLESILVAEDFDLTNIENQSMFASCNKLVGGNGTKWSSEHIDNSYARADEIGESGYFTLAKYTLPNNWYNANITGMQKYNITKIKISKYPEVEPKNHSKEYDIAGSNGLKGYLNGTEITIYASKKLPIYTAENSRYTFSSNNLEIIEGLDILNTSITTNMSYMFSGCENLTSIDSSNFDTSNATNMEGMFNYCRNLTTLNLSSFNTSNVTNMAHMFHDCNNLTTLNLSSFNTSKVRDMSCMFSYAENLKTLDLSNFNTSNVIDMSDMFTWCVKLTSLNLSNFDTKEVTNMRSMFYNNKNLETLDISNFNTSNVTNMSDMFSWCVKLTSLNLSNFNTSNVTDMSYMFYNGYNLTTLDLSSFDTRNVTNMESMFYGCKNLTTLDLSSFESSKLTKASYMFYYCSNLDTIFTAGEFDLTKISESVYMFYGCNKLKGGNNTTYNSSHTDKSYARIDTKEIPGYFTEKYYELSSNWYNSEITKIKGKEIKSIKIIKRGDRPQKYDVEWDIANSNGLKCYLNGKEVIIYAAKNLTIYTAEDSSYLFSSNTSGECFEMIEKIDGLNNLNTSKTTNMSHMFYRAIILRSFDLSSFDTKNVEDMSYMFCFCIYGITQLDLSSFDTSKVTNMRGMFDYCEKLTSLNLSKFNTSRVEDMAYMFYHCENLTSLNLSNFNTSKVKDMSYMFEKCNKLTSLNLSNFNTSEVKDMSYMFSQCENLPMLNLNNFDAKNVIEMTGIFQYCQNLNTLNLSNFNTEKVKYMGGMFFNCSKLATLDLSKFDTSNVYDMSCMFGGCNIMQLDLSKFDTSNVQKMGSMFYNCKNIATLDLSKFDTKNVTNMSKMFQGCQNLSTLDLNNFNTSEVIDMSNMFSNCEKLTTLDLNNFDTSKVIDMSNMFYNCNKLTTINLDNFNTSNVKKMDYMFSNCGEIKKLDLSSFSFEKITNVDSMFAKCNKLESVLVSMDFDLTNKNVSDKNMFDGTNSLVGEYGTTYSSEHIDNSYARADEIEKSGYFTLVRYTLSPDWYNTSAMGIKKNNITKIKISRKPELKPENYNKEYDIAGSNGLKCYLNGTEVTIYASKKLPIYTAEYSRYLFSNNNKSKVDINGIYDDPIIFENLESIDGLNYLNTSETTDMSGMFYGCESLITLDLSKFDTKNVTDMSGMFSGCQKLSTLDLNNFDTSKVIYMTSMFYNCNNLTELNVSSFDTSKVKGMSYMFYNCKKITEINASSFNTSNVINMPRMFDGCQNLSSLDLSKFDTSKVESMSHMLSNCAELMQLDLSSFDTRNVKDMSCMFGGCMKLMQLDLSSFDTSNVTDMSYMFYNCNNLTTFDLSGFDTRNVEDMSSMFYGCMKLMQLDLSSFDTRNVKDMSSMFYGCMKLMQLDLSSFDTRNVTYMSYMFCSCYNLTILDLSSFTSDKLLYVDSMFQYCNNLIKILASEEFDLYNTQGTGNSLFSGCIKLAGYKGTRYSYANVNKTYAHVDCKDGKPGYFTLFNEKSHYVLPANWWTPEMVKRITSQNNTGGYWSGADEYYEEYEKRGAYPGGFLRWDDVIEIQNVITEINISKFPTPIPDDYDVVYDIEGSGGLKCYRKGTSLTIYAPKNLQIKTTENSSYLFSSKNFAYRFLYLQTINGLENLDTELTTNMSNMFRDARSLTSLNLNSLNTKKVSDMSYMFSGVGSVSLLNLGNFDTREVKNMSYMFAHMKELKKINISTFNTSKVTNMEGLFYDVKDITSIDLSNFNTVNVTNMKGMFSNAYKLNSMDLSSFNTSKVVDMSYMFEYTCNLQSINLSSFDTSNVKNISYIFSHSVLNSIDLSNFNTSNVYDMSGMFYGTKISSIDLSNFNTENVVDMSYMFYKCDSLNNLDLSSFDTSNVIDMSWMFAETYNLTELNISNFNTHKVGNMHFMFYACYRLEELDLSSFTLSELEEVQYACDRQYMFFDCINLRCIKVNSNFDLTNFNNGASENMFYNCTNLVGSNGTKYSDLHIDGSYACIDKDGKPGYFTDKNEVLKDRYYVLSPNWWAKTRELSLGWLCGYVGKNDFCIIPIGEEEEDIISITISKFPTPPPTEYYSQQWGPIEEYDIADSNGLKVYKIGTEQLIIYAPEDLPIYTAKDSSYLFSSKDSTYEFFKLQSISGLEYLDTSRTTNMSYMFSGCNKLTYLDLSNFDVSNVTNASYMFSNCERLTTVKVNNDFDLTNDSSNCNSTNMFLWTPKLVGGNGTRWSSQYTSGEYACIDGKNGKTGYFTFGVKRIIYTTYIR